MYSAAYIWAKVIHYLEEHLGPQVVSDCLDDAEVVQMDETQLILYSPSALRRESIHRLCKQSIAEALRELFRLEPELAVWGDSELKNYHDRQSAKPTRACDPHFSFENFIAGSSNSVPLLAAQHVANAPGDPMYNPLYLYGTPGTGKTHLLHAIANHISRHAPELKLVCVNGEQFTNDMVQNILRGGITKFRNKYRDADVLLIDDIQFIAGKEATQEEFYYMYCYLTEHHKQIVLTSDRKPDDIPALLDEVKCRLSEGVLVELCSPDSQI